MRLKPPGTGDPLHPPRARPPDAPHRIDATPKKTTHPIPAPLRLCGRKSPKPPTQKPPFHCGPCASSLREPIHQAHLPLRARRHAGIVGRDDEGHPVFLPKLQQQVHHAITGVGIQVAGGFIRQHECG